jgi:hypothetical protein
MSTRHRIVAVTLLSSSLAAASPASQPRPVAKSVHAELARFIDRVAVRAHALTDDEGYPLVGNMHGKRPAPVEKAEPRKLEPHQVELALVDPFPAGK